MSADRIATFDRMERMYRPQRHVYDLTRRPYLLGRDRCLRELQAAPGATILDIGCGTGRNLAALARLYPSAVLAGLDPSRTMLDAAARKTKGVLLRRGVAEDLPASVAAGTLPRPDHVLFSYSLSIMPDAEQALTAALAVLPKGGCLHFVDFGDMADLPVWLGGAMRAWLGRFGVRHKPEVVARLEALEGGQLVLARPWRRYCEIGHFQKRLMSRDCKIRT